MRRGWLAIAASVLVLAADGEIVVPGPTPRARVIDVQVEDFSYKPATVRVRLGDTVRWTQRDAFPHSVTTTNPEPDQPGGFDKPLVAIGETVEVKITSAGTISYFCRPHPYMKGTIEVAR
jgi:plastocyanin